jgi:hypothetical protein
MAYVTCAISGVLFECSHFNTLRLPANIGYPHPIFAANKTFLQSLYVQHSKGLLDPTDSYLLFLAYLHSSGKIDWRHPATAIPNSAATKQMVENNLSQLLAMLQKTEAIRHPRFKQPAFVVNYENSNLAQVPNWIKAWNDNIESFYSYTSDQVERDALTKVENKLTNLILSGEPAYKYASTIAAWASKAGDFPANKDAGFQEIIRSCFNATKMFSTPLVEIKEVKAYCEENIEVGSMHFHALSEALNSGIHKHIDYLGGSSLALGYSILPSLTDDDTDTNRASKLGNLDGNLVSLADSYTSSAQREQLKNQQQAATAKLHAMIANAPLSLPNQSDYATLGEFLKAKLAYRVASTAAKELAKSKAQLANL